MNGHAEQTVSEVAARSFLIETTRQSAAPENSAFEQRFTNPKNNPFLGWDPEPHTIRGYLIADAVVDGQFRALWNRAGLIRGTNYLCPEDELLQVSISSAAVVDSLDESNIIIGCNQTYNNYFHWITQALPAIDFSLRRDGQVRRVALALPVLNAWQEESLELLGYQGLKRIVIDDANKFYAFKSVEFTELLTGGASFGRSETTAATYSRLRLSVPRKPGQGDKIYVARTDSFRRRMRNEDALLEELQRRGFQIVVPGALSLTEQIRRFREASLVVGAHGAGLTNIVFCEPGTIVYELVPIQYPNVCFGTLALICRLRYWADGFDSEGVGPPSARDWDLDMTRVTQRLNEIEAILAELQDTANRRTINALEFLRGDPGHLVGSGSPEVIPSVVEPVAAPPRGGFLRRLLGR